MIDSADMERLKEIFVTRRECDTITDDLRETLNGDKIVLDCPLPKELQAVIKQLPEMWAEFNQMKKRLAALEENKE